jgi:hypothetical protein
MRLLLGIAALLSLTAWARPSDACSVAAGGGPVAIPRPGATKVPTIVDVKVISGSSSVPVVTLRAAAGDVVPLGGLLILGHGFDAITSVHGTFYRGRPQKQLLPVTEYVIAVDGADVGRFTTGSGYDKPAGAPPVVKSVELTRVRYPIAEIASGNCVFAEYHGFASFEWSLGMFPNTPADSVVHALSLFAKTGGTAESFLYLGTTPFAGNAAVGEHPDPTGFWQPYLDPTREYCFAVTAEGYGEATLATRSEQVCGSVAQKSTPGAAASATASDAPADATASASASNSPAEASGCTLSRTRHGVSFGAAALLLLIGRRYRRRSNR